MPVLDRAIKADFQSMEFYEGMEILVSLDKLYLKLNQTLRCPDSNPATIISQSESLSCEAAR